MPYLCQTNLLFKGRLNCIVKFLDEQKEPCHFFKILILFICKQKNRKLNINYCHSLEPCFLNLSHASRGYQKQPNSYKATPLFNNSTVTAPKEYIYHPLPIMAHCWTALRGLNSSQSPVRTGSWVMLLHPFSGLVKTALLFCSLPSNWEQISCELLHALYDICWKISAMRGKKCY